MVVRKFVVDATLAFAADISVFVQRFLANCYVIVNCCLKKVEILSVIDITG